MGYFSDNEALSNSQNAALATTLHANVSSNSLDGEQPPRKNRRIENSIRERRNAREKERSFRISRQINELRDLLSSGGVIVPKGTKSSVLTEAANYIRMLQQHQYNSEM